MNHGYLDNMDKILMLHGNLAKKDNRCGITVIVHGHQDKRDKMLILNG